MHSESTTWGPRSELKLNSGTATVVEDHEKRSEEKNAKKGQFFLLGSQKFSKRKLGRGGGQIWIDVNEAPMLSLASVSIALVYFATMKSVKRSTRLEL